MLTTMMTMNTSLTKTPETGEVYNMIQETIYTAAPWHATEYSSVAGCMIAAEPLSKAHQAFHATIRPLSDAEEAKANARLIAAAPDLLEALIRALPYVLDVLDNPEHLACFKKGTVQADVKAIRAAIARTQLGQNL